MKKKSIIQISVLILCIGILASVGSYMVAKGYIPMRSNKGIALIGDKTECFVDGRRVVMQDKAYTRDGYAYISVDDVLPALGFTVTYNQKENVFVCVKDGVITYIFPILDTIWSGTAEYVFDHKPIMVSGRMYISDKMLTSITGKTVTVEGQLSEYLKITLQGEQLTFDVDGKSYPLSQRAFSLNDKAYMPVEDVLPALGYILDWNGDINGISCTRDGVVSYVFPSRNNIWVGYNEHIFDSKPMVIHNKTYVSAEVIKILTGSDVAVSGQLVVMKNGISVMQSQRTDAYRLAGASVVSGGGVTVVDGFGMEFPVIPEANAVNYAQVINQVAESLDSNINVYNMVVPTAAEFYAPQQMYPNQLSGIQTIYSNLSDRVISVNVYDVLAKNAGEKIYFKTDHHWTQRGAYYAYKEFMNYKCVDVPDISTFQNVPSESFVGSFASFAKGTPAGKLMSSSPELLERFVPKYATTGKVYSNPSLSAPTATVQAVNTNWTSYSAFINGDNPITVFDTNAPGDKTIVIIKESYGNAFATWAMNDYKRVCVIDPRRFNGFGGNNTRLNLNEFCRRVGATDVMFINYPIVVSSDPIKQSMLKMK